MEKALEILKQFKTQIETCPDDCWFELEQVNEAISELEEYHEFAESIRMLCDDRGGHIAELEEAMKSKKCDWCKWNAQVGNVGIFHCWKSRELHYCQANGFIDYCNEFEPKDNA